MNGTGDIQILAAFQQGVTTELLLPLLVTIDNIPVLLVGFNLPAVKNVICIQVTANFIPALMHTPIPTDKHFLPVRSIDKTEANPVLSLKCQQRIGTGFALYFVDNVGVLVRKIPFGKTFVGGP